MTTSRATTGGEVIWNSPGPSNAMLGSIRTVPSAPKPEHGLPVAASNAISRPSTVPVNTRVAHTVSAAAPGSAQAVTPRQVNWLAGR